MAKQRFIVLILMAASLFLQGCALLGAAMSLGAAYGISKLFSK